MITVIKVEPNENGSHDNNTCYSGGYVPDGWAVLLSKVGTPTTLENFPFGDITVDDTQTPPVVTSWTPLPMPDSAEKTPAQLREEAYNTEAIIAWDGEMITVTQASQLWQYYAAEGSIKAYDLQALIAAAKAEIREKYPDE